MKTKSKQPDSQPALPMNRILVPVDFSAPSRKLVPYAAALARKSGASLVLLHVVEHINVPTRVAYAATGLQDIVLARGRKLLAEFAARLAPTGVKTTEVVRVGRPWQEITRTARSERADLIVIATHGHTGLQRFILGSTAERVLRHAACPVLVVR